MTDNIPTNEDQKKTIVQEQSLDSGRETMHLRILFDATAIDQNLRPIRISTPYPVDNTPNPSTSQSSSYGHRRLPSRSISPNTSLSNDFRRRHPNITTQYNTSRPPDFPRLSESSESFTDGKIFLIALRKASMRTLDPHLDQFPNLKDLNGQIVLQTFMEIQFHLV